MMNSGDKLLGFKGQSMGGPKDPLPVELTQYFGVGSYTFTAPTSGRYKFVIQGGGGGGSGSAGGGGGAGGYAEITRSMVQGETATLVVGPGGSAANGSLSSVTFADGKVVTANGGSVGVAAGAGGAGGTATGGDVNLTGGAGGSGTTGAAGSAGSGTAPGAGGAGNGSNVGGGGGCSGNTPYTGSKGGDATENIPANYRPGRGASGNTNITQYSACGGFVFVVFLGKF